MRGQVQKKKNIRWGWDVVFDQHFWCIFP